MNDVKKRAALNFKFVADNPQKMMRQGRRSTLEKFADSVKEVKEEVAPLLVCAVASCFLVYFLVAPWAARRDSHSTLPNADDDFMRSLRATGRLCQNEVESGLSLFNSIQKI